MRVDFCATLIAGLDPATHDRAHRIVFQGGRHMGGHDEFWLMR